MGNVKVQMLIENYIETYVFALNRVHQVISETSMGSTNLSMEQFFTLREIAVSDEITARGIAKKFGVTKTAIATKLKRLEEQNYIKKQRNPADKREIQLKITSLGYEVYTKYEQRMEELVSKWVVTLGEKDSEAFIELFKKLRESIIQVDQASSKHKGENK